MIGGKLTECEIVEQRYVQTDIDGESSLLVKCHHGEEVVSFDNFYESVENFKCDIHPITTSCELYSHCFKFEDKDFTTYTIVDNAVVKMHIEPKNVVYRDVDVVIADLPDRCFSSREDAMQFLPIHVVYQDGSEKCMKSLNDMYSLSEEQKMLVDNIAKAVKAAEDAGIFLYINDGDIHALVDKDNEIEMICGRDDDYIAICDEIIYKRGLGFYSCYDEHPAIKKQK